MDSQLKRKLSVAGLIIATIVGASWFGYHEGNLQQAEYSRLAEEQHKRDEESSKHLQQLIADQAARAVLKYNQSLQLPGQNEEKNQKTHATESPLQENILNAIIKYLKKINTQTASVVKFDDAQLRIVEKQQLKPDTWKMTIGGFLDCNTIDFFLFFGPSGQVFVRAWNSFDDSTYAPQLAGKKIRNTNAIAEYKRAVASGKFPLYTDWTENSQKTGHPCLFLEQEIISVIGQNIVNLNNNLYLSGEKAYWGTTNLAIYEITFLQNNTWRIAAAGEEDEYSSYFLLEFREKEASLFSRVWLDEIDDRKYTRQLQIAEHSRNSQSSPFRLQNH